MVAAPVATTITVSIASHPPAVVETLFIVSCS
jgi:hypothetical protein